MRDTNNPDANITNAKGREEWRCRFCTTTYDVTSSTTNARDHLRNYHGIDANSDGETRVRNIQIAIQAAIEACAANPHKQKRLDTDTPVDRVLDGNSVEALFVNFIASCNLPLRLVECNEFRAFLTYLNDDINAHLPTSDTSIRKWVLRQFNAEKERVKHRVQNPRTKIHLSLDIWTSPNCKPIIGVIAHYISGNNVLEETVLAVKEIEGSHKGENLAPVVMEVIREWGIASKLGYIVMDNASNNDTMMAAISTGKYSILDLRDNSLTL
jgi:hypothetical protein